jgi:hypothetical protein
MYNSILNGFLSKFNIKLGEQLSLDLPIVPIVQGAGWAPEPVWAQRLEERCFASAGDRTPIVQSVVTHYNELPQLQLLHPY